ncbi:Hypothetical_protein [Hexamita inflata]|uniref:Hypothetical_protein n=1 Tax=Hexamita inflata TaxID=28002 RepID=A0AA86TSD2_9EUKA|nr:Hypothetical protein HINF_LOCUS14759 [Hexamita inflata]
MQIMINILAVVLKAVPVICYHTTTMNVLESTFIQTISSAVKHGDYANVDQTVAYDMMMLPDNAYSFLISTLFYEHNINVTYLHQQIQTMTTRLLVIPHRAQQSATPAVVEIQMAPNSKHQRISSFQQLFRQAITEVLYRYDKSVDVKDDVQLCSQVNRLFERSGKIQFWLQVQELIPDKTVKQLREYYSKSFQRILFCKSIDCQDKLLLRGLVNQLGDKKPSEIAHRFQELAANKNYFQRNIIMYIINLKRRVTE